VIYRIVHATEYLYGAPVSTSHHELHLLPRLSAHQHARGETLQISPAPGLRRDRVDVFGNRCTHVEIWEPHRRLSVVSRAEVEVIPPPPLGGEGARVDRPWEAVRDDARQPRTPGGLEAAGLVFASPYVPIDAEAGAYAAVSFTPGRPLLAAALELTARIHADFTYDAEATTVATPVAEVLRQRRGVCQDFAHLQIACLRALGLPARYVSGYLSTTPPPGRERVVGADASHAWVQVFSPDAGWIALDPTNDAVVTDRHVTVAWGRDFGDVTPIRGVIMGGGRHDLQVSVDVAPVSI
jgi:transglutaminase-like putative cysteine protease